MENYSAVRRIIMKYIKSIILCFTIFYLYGCQETPVIHKMHVDILENQLDTIRLSDYTDFDWDRALFFNDYLTCAYHEKDFIEKTYNFSLNALSLSISEFAIPVVFIKDGRIVHVEVNGEETFPDDEKKWEMETIEFIYPQGKAPLIQEVKRENCKFKAWTDGYQKHHAIMLENIP